MEELKTEVTGSNRRECPTRDIPASEERNNRKRKISGEDQESESNTSKSRKVSAESDKTLKNVNVVGDNANSDKTLKNVDDSDSHPIASNTSKSRKVSASSKSLDESEKEERKTKNSVGAWKCRHCTKTCTTYDNLR